MTGFLPEGTARSTARLGLGLAALGRPAYINLGHASDLEGRSDAVALEALCHSVLDSAHEAGVRYFDVARSYGQAERFLASWIEARSLGPDQVLVGSKWGYTYTGGWQVDAEVHEVKDLSLSTLRRQYAESNSLLGRNLCLYQIHSATIESGVLEDGAVIEELARIRSGGLLIGITVTGARQASTIERALEVGGFDAVQATWNLLERSAGEMLEAAHAEGLVVIVKEAVANGRLTVRGNCTGLHRIALEAGSTPDAVAIAVALAEPWVDVVLSGATTVNELRSNLAARELELSKDMLEDLDSLREEPRQYWRTRSSLPWN
jgi:aryl-alcohol dehydrogenase-like predicted oxidoreductase